MSIALALLSSVFWGFGDFFLAISARKFGAWNNFIFTRIVGIIVLLPLAILFINSTQFTFQNVITAFIISQFLAIGVLFYLKSVELGNATLNGTIAGSSILITVLLSIALFYEKPSHYQIFAIFIVIIGVLVTSLDIRNSSVSHLVDKGTVYALLTMITWGVYFALVKIPSKELGWFWPSFFSRVGVFTYLPFILRKKVNFNHIKSISSFGLLVIAALLPTFGDLTYNAGVINSYVSLFAPVASSYLVIYVLLTHYWFREKIKRIQKIGIVLTLLGVILLGV